MFAEDPTAPPDPNAAILLGIRVLAGRHLSRKSGRGMVSPFVEIELCGADYDGTKRRTKTIGDNGYNPFWDEAFDFKVRNPDLALLRFVVYDVDMFGEPNFLGHYTVPVACVRTGVRSLPLKNAFSEDLELSSLLINLKVKSARGETSELAELRKTAQALEERSEMSLARGDLEEAEALHSQAQKKERDVVRLIEES